MGNVFHDPHAPRLGVSLLMQIRHYFDEPQLWVCTFCRWSEEANIQQRCPNCDRLMLMGKK